MLPPALHKKYATPEEKAITDGRVQQLIGGITKGLLEQRKEDAEEALRDHPDIVREKRLRLGSSRSGLGRTGIQELSGSSRTALQKTQPIIPNPDSYTAIAAEHFVMPLINHMWLHLRDASTRTNVRAGAGTGIIFDTIVLSQYLGTLAVLIHAARHSPAFLAIIAPAAFEMGLTLGNRQVSVAEINASESQSKVPIAAVIVSALELVLVVLDGSMALDQGRRLALEHDVLLKAAGAWAGEVLDAVEAGKKMPGGGGDAEGKLGAAAAGVVIGIQKVEEKWGRAMRIDY